MIKNKYLLVLTIPFLFVNTLKLNAQNGTASPYSMFGVGTLNRKGDVVNAGMGYTGVALKSQGYLNTLNPASYSAMDSLTFLFNMQGSGTFGRFESGSQTRNNFGANIDGLSFGFKVSDKWGMNIGFAPYSSIGYSIVSDKYIIGTSSTYPIEYSCEGGLTQLYWGNGFELFRGFSLGLNLSLVWGSLERIESSYYPEITGETIHNRKSWHANNLYLEYGFQYHLPIHQNTLSFGGTMNMETTLNTSYEHTISTDSDQEYYNDTENADNLMIPTKYAAGVAYQTHTGWTMALDYHYKKWSSFETPVVSSAVFRNTSSYQAGVQYAPQRMGYRSIFRRMQYRAGVFYSDNYLSLNGIDLDEKGFTLGVSLPIKRKTMLNVGYEWKKAGSSEAGLINETYHTIKMGITFNELWFQKQLFQ